MRKFIGISAAAALLAGASLVTGVAGPTHAFAATCVAGSTVACPTSSVAINANNTPYQLLGVTYSPFKDITLNGQDQNTVSNGGNYATVLDASGTGTGWNVTVQATPLFNNAKSDTIAGPNIGTLAASSSCGTTGFSCRGNAAPAGSGIIDSSAGAVKVLSAPAGAGMGQYQVTLGSLSATIPANVYAGTYSTTITVTLIGGTP